MSRASRSILVHLHIPKNAGTTLSRMLKMHILLHPPTRLLHHESVLGYYFTPGHAEDRLRRIEAARERARRRIRFFEAHCGYGVHLRLPGPCVYATMLRDPVDRALSVFYFRKQQGDLPAGTSLREWIEAHPADPVWHVDNAHVRYLASDDGAIIDCPIGGVTREMLDRAKSRLAHDIAFVGLVERFDESVVLLRRLLGWRSLRYARSNVTRERKASAEIPDREAQTLRELNAHDLELHAFAQRLFTERVAAAGRGFAEELARFRAGNARHTRRFGWAYDRLSSIRRLVSRDAR